MNEPTDAELLTLAEEIYWHLEHGENREAVQKLRNVLNSAFDRGADE